MTTDAGDNRIRLDTFPVNDSVRDQTGQLHDEYPSANTQAFADFMRTYLIGLMANQSSDEQPIETHPGMFWFNKKLLQMMLFWDDEFHSLANFIGVDTGDEQQPTESLQSILDRLVAGQQFVAPTFVYSGVFTADEQNQILIPEEYQGYVAAGLRPLVYLDGALLDPRTTIIQPGDNTTIFITGGYDPKSGQTFTVILQHITAIKEETVAAPGG